MHITDTYYRAMEVLDAQDKMHSMTMADWPNMKQGSKKKLHRYYHRIGFPASHSNPVSPVELAKLLGAGKL